MKKTARSRPKTYFTLEEANARLPLVRSIVRDIADLANKLHDRREYLMRIQTEGSLGDVFEEEEEHIKASFEKDRQKMSDYERELAELGVELKDYFIGLIDFPCIKDDREVYLCWKLGEAEVTHWHELEGGFAGRQRITANFAGTKDQALA